MLKRFQLEDYKLVSIPMTVGCKLSKDDESKVVDPKHYISMIGNLLYVTTSRPDVKQDVGMVAIFQEATKEIHVQTVKRIFRYLKGTIDLGL
jgi:protein associated with RNAse G/E